MQTRRAHIRSLTGLAVGAVLPATGSGLSSRDDAGILNRLMLHLLGLEETELFLEPALRRLFRLAPFVDQGQLAAFLRNRYPAAQGVDYERFLADIERGEHPEMGYLVRIIRTEAILAYYSSQPGWRETDYAGVPVGRADLPLSLG